MSSFTGPLSMTHLDARHWRLWQTNEPIIYEVGDKGSGKKITVPAGFITDGASVPRFLWPFLPSWGRYARAAVVHDYLCVLGRSNIIHPHCKSRREADYIFWEAVRVCGVNPFTALILFCGVRFGSIFPKLANKVPDDQKLPDPSSL